MLLVILVAFLESPLVQASNSTWRTILAHGLHPREQLDAPGPDAPRKWHIAAPGLAPSPMLFEMSNQQCQQGAKLRENLSVSVPPPWRARGKVLVLPAASDANRLIPSSFPDAEPT
jgi:hypothetical protein